MRFELAEEQHRLRHGENWDKYIPYIHALDGKPNKTGRCHAPTPNLYLFVTAKGKRRWLFRYSRVDKTGVTEISLGPYPQVTEAKAITKAEELHKLIANGIDPQADKRRRRGEKVTFAETADEWIELQKGAWSESSIRNAHLLLHVHGKALANKPIGRINEDHIQAALASLWATAPIQARRALAMWAQVFDFAKVKKLYSGDNPASWSLQKLLSPKQPNGERPHLPALPYAELPNFIQGQLRAKQSHATAAVALEFTILTACRTSEVLDMRWEEIEADVWTIPASRMKARRPHRVPLSGRAMELLDRRLEQRKGPFVFTGYTDKPLADKAMMMLLRSMGVKASVHGFRSSFSDWAYDKKFAPETIEQCLAHQVGPKVARAYRRGDDLEARRPLMDAWSAYCGGPQTD
jgi:integrase